MSETHGVKTSPSWRTNDGLSKIEHRETAQFLGDINDCELITSNHSNEACKYSTKQ